MLSAVGNRHLGGVSAPCIVTVSLLVIGLLALKIGGSEESDVCSSWEDRRYLSVLREDLLAKLTPLLPFNLTSEQPTENNRNPHVDPGLLSAFQALSEVLRDGESAEPASCVQPDRGRGTPAFAKRISLFFPETTNVSSFPLHGAEQRGQTSSAASQPIKYFFSFKPILPSQTLYSAELRLFKKVISHSQDLFENVEVFHVRRRGDGEELERHIVSLKNMELISDEYESFNVLDAVSRWIEHAGQNETLELEVIINGPYSITTGSFSSPSIEFIRDNGTMIDDDDDFSETRPQLVVATVNEEVATLLKRRRRKRRQAVPTDYCQNNPETISCCIRRLEVNFHQDLNFTWVMFPANFTPNYCQGLCPIPFSGDIALRHEIQNFYLENNIGNGPCCAIYEMNSLPMIFRDHYGQIHVEIVPNMEINSCGCVD